MKRTKHSKGAAIVLGVGIIIVPLSVGSGSLELLLFYFVIQALVLMFHTHEIDDEVVQPQGQVQMPSNVDVNEMIGMIEEKRDEINITDIIKYEKLLRIYRSNSDDYNRRELIKFIKHMQRFYNL